MSFRRQIEPRVRFHEEELTGAMIGVGMHFFGERIPEPPVEDVLYWASVAGMERDDLRVLSVLTSWIEVYRKWLHVNRLVRIIELLGTSRTRAYWASIGTVYRKSDVRFLAFEPYRPKRAVHLLRSGSDFQLKRKGEDETFRGSSLRIPKDTLRIRTSDVLPPGQLARIHATIKSRMMQGPSYRADMWAAMERDPDLSASELARRTYGSFQTARLVREDFQLLKA